MSDVSGVVVTGGQDLEVRLDDLAAAAAELADAGAGLLAVAAAVGQAVGQAELVGSAVVDPGGAARSAAAGAAAVAGPRGLLATALAVETRSGELTVAAARYRAADVLAEPARDVRRWAQGTVAVVALPALLLGGAAWVAGRTAAGGDPAAEAEAFLLAHPGVVDEVVGSAPGAVRTALQVALGPLALPADRLLRETMGTGLLPGSLEDSAATLALLYPDGPAVVTTVARDVVPAPRDLAGVVALLAAADAQARGAAQGQVTVLQAPLPDGRTGTVVLLPGTKDWQPDPRSRPHVNDLATNLELLAGAPSARLDGVRLALDAAGVRPGDPVVLVGHSQGGMLALRAAAQLPGVTHVATLGSPVAGMPVPDGVEVLSLENRQDVVPRLDAAPNTPSARHVTVAFDVAAPGLGDEHGLEEAYLPAAGTVDASDDPAVRAWLAGAQQLLGDGPVTATVVRIDGPR